MSKVVIERPEVLCKNHFYYQNLDQYCSIGHLGKCLTGKQGEEISKVGSEIMIDIIEKIECNEKDLFKLMNKNDLVNSNEERLQIFENWCNEHNVILVDKETF